MGGGDPNVEDEEVTFPGERGWGPSDCSPSHPEENVGHLLSTLAARFRLGIPRINTFSGVPPQEKQRYPLSSGTMRYNVSRITTWNWWSKEVLLDH